MDIGRTIYSLRKNKGMTQEQLAEAVGISVPAVSKWETGSTLPDIALLAPIARSLGTDIDYLLSFKSELSEEEAEAILNEIKKVCEKEGFRKGMARAEEFLKEYPNSEYLKLKLSAPAVSFGYTIDEDYTDEEYNELSDRMIKRLTGLVNSDNYTISAAAKVSLAVKYMHSEKFEEAEALLNQLPKQEAGPDRLLPTLYLRKGELSKSLKLSQRALLMDLQYTLMDIMSMYTVKKEQGDYEAALIFAESYRTLVMMFGNHLPGGADLIVDVYIKMGDIGKAIQWFQTYIDDTIEMDSAYGKDRFFNQISRDIVSASPDSPDVNIKRTLYKAIMLNPNYEVLKDYPEYIAALLKLKAACNL